MMSVGQNIALRQYLVLLPSTRLACPLVNCDYKKLTEYALVKSFILANLFHWESFPDIAKGICSKPIIQKELEPDSISSSQLSRRLAELDTRDLADLLGMITRLFWLIRGNAPGVNANVGILKLIDSTHIKLPKNASTWTAVSKDSNGVKLHLRLAIASADEAFPEKMIPSTA